MRLLRKINLTAFLLLAGTGLWAQTSMREGVAALEEKFGVHFVYDASLPLEKQGGRADAATLELALRQLFGGSDIGYELKGDHVILRRIPRLTISGLITDAATGETLIGAAATSGKHGAVSNNFGFYSLTIPAEKADVIFSYVGYLPKTVSVRAGRDTTIHVRLVPGASLEEAIVTAPREAGISSTRMGAIEVPVMAVKSVPALFGEADILKTIQLLPGVQGGTEGFSGLYVRGGGPDENLLLLDGIPLYHAEHMLGIFSVFQPEAVKKVTLYKSSFPARYGGRISSIVDVRTNDGNLYETHGSVGVSMIGEKLHIEGPIWKGKTSYSVSARGDNFYYRNSDQATDARTGQPISDKQKLGMRWGNTVAALRWNHVVTPHLFANTTVAFNRYHMRLESDLKNLDVNPDGGMEDNRFLFDYRSGMRDWVAKADLDYTPSSSHKVKFGAEYTFHTFIPETMTGYVQQYIDGTPQADTTLYMRSNSLQRGHEASLYAEDDIRIGRHLSLNPGLRATLFNTQGRTYWSLEPRLSAKVNFTDNWCAKASYSRMAQYVHLLSSSQITLPVDLWVPITRNFRPETSDQFSLGLYFDGLPGWSFSIEGYYKAIQNVMEYKDGVAFLFDSSGWENKVEVGSGRAMGVELFIEKTTGKTTGWLGYTLAKSDRLFPTINHGQRFPYRYDRRHNVNLVVNHRFNEKFDISLTWNYASGGVTTLPERRVILSSPTGELSYADIVSSRNNYRLPSSHTLNLGFNFHRKHTRGEGIWNLSIYNVYNHMNPTLVQKETVEWQQIQEVRIKKTTLLPIFPSIGYTRTF